MMRNALVLALALSAVPLFAGDGEPLKESIESWRQPNATGRDAASAQVDRHLRKLLAPLLEAMNDKDTEVRRRARESILALVPHAKEEQQAKTDRAGRFGLVRGNLQVAAQRQAVLQALAQQKQAQRAAEMQLRAAREEQRRQLRAQAMARTREALLLQKRQVKFGLRTTEFRKWPGSIQATLRVYLIVPNSPAHALGLEHGDTILFVNGRRVTDVAVLLDAIGDRPDFRKVSLTVRRGNQTLTLPIVR